MIKKDILQEYQQTLKGKSAQEIISWALKTFNREDIALASSLGAEDQVLTDIILKEDSEAQIFTLDTGRLNEETYSVIEDIKEKYKKNIEILFPVTSSVKDLVNSNGINLFYESVENRKKCCKVRKIEPLKEKLSTLKVWITGLRKDQSVTRDELEIISWDEAFGLLKISPLAAWSEDDVWNYIKENSVPYNTLHDKGFPSIGCSPCTRAIKTGEDVRAGRWWWEEPENKECGIHIVDGKVVRGRG